MASIQTRTNRDGTRTHRVMWRQDGKQRNLAFTDIRAAERFRRDIEAHGPAEALAVLDIIDDTDTTGPTLDDWLADYITGLTGIQPGTRASYQRYRRNDMGTLSALPLAAITPELIGQWIQGMADKKAASKTIKNKHAFLSGALKAAVVAGKIDANPCDGQRIPRTVGREMIMLSKDEFAAVRSQIKLDRWADLATWLVTTGMRFSEATALGADDIDLTGRTCRINKAWKSDGQGGRVIGPPKTVRSVRTVNLADAAIEVVRRRMADPAVGEYLFCNSSGTAATSQEFYNRAWGPARRVLPEHRRARVHDLRHTCASWMIAAGVPLLVVSRHLGHEDIAVTANVYSHVDRSSFEAAAAAIDAVLG